MFCNKKKLDKVKAMMIVAKAQSPASKNSYRREIRYYWCDKCKAYHTTSQKYKTKG